MDYLFKANAVLSKFSRNYMQLKKDLPVRPSEMGVLNIIAETRGPHTPVMLANMLGVSRPMITAHLSVLAEKGYITRQQSPQDKRVFYVLPTDKARKLVENTKKETNALLKSISQQMEPGSFEALVNLLERVNGILSEQQKK